MKIALKGITWSHSRGYTSIVAVSQRYEELNQGVNITWEKRSLQEFADAPLEKLARLYDLLIIDYPWAGYAAESSILLPLEKYLPKEYMEDQKRNSVGKSFESYCFAGHQTALPIDAAAPVSVYRPDYFLATGKKVPETWDDVLDLAEEGTVIYAGIPINLLMDFYMFAVTKNMKIFTEDKMISLEDGCEVLEEMRKLAMLCSRKIFDYDPIAVHEQLASDSGVFYCPFTYGYTNYSRKGYGQHLLKAADVPNYGGNMLRTVLGGTGLAVSSFCHNAEKAAAFAEYTASPDIQSTLYYDGGGQPAHRKAWTDSYTNGNCLDFFKDTLKTLDNAYLRPRYSGYLYFQDRAGDIVREYVMNGGNADTAVEKLNVLYLNSKGRH